jgi:type IV secretion system protein VirB1
MIMLPMMLLATCSPLVDPVTMSAVVQNESGGNPLAMHDNADGKSYSPKSLDEAVTLAKRLISSGHSVDLGLAQINSKNLQWVGMTVEQSFDACSNLQASQQVLVDAHKRSGGDLQKTLQIYNTGKTAGSQYSSRVYGKAGVVVPAIPGGTLAKWTKSEVEVADLPKIQSDDAVQARVQWTPAASPLEADGTGFSVAW